MANSEESAHKKCPVKFEDFRERVEPLVIKGTMPLTDIAKAVGVSLRTLAKWVKKHWPNHARAHGRPPASKNAVAAVFSAPKEEEQEPGLFSGPVPSTEQMVDDLKRVLAAEIRSGFAGPGMAVHAQTLRVLSDVLERERANEPDQDQKAYVTWYPQTVERYRDGHAGLLPAPDEDDASDKQTT